VLQVWYFACSVKLFHGCRVAPILFLSHRIKGSSFLYSSRVSGGLITIWNSNIFEGEVMFINSHSIIVKFKSLLSGRLSHVTNIYGPAASAGKVGFISWLYNFDCSSMDDWLLIGDFNLIRSPENRNRPGGNFNEMWLFNDLIQHLDLVEISFQGRYFTWSNMQYNALLEKLDWVFTSASWSLSYPDTKVLPCVSTYFRPCIICRASQHSSAQIPNFQF
jgi:hypothetical protein